MPRANGGPATKKLAFKEKLVTKGQSTDAILRKLKTLHLELAAMEQEQVDVRSLGTVQKDLINISLLMHKDKGVKAYTACCLADILRLCAPNAPYTDAELRDIFQFFFKQLSSGLKGPDSAYYNEYYHLVESLSTVKTVVLAGDLPDSEELMVEIFRAVFALVRRDLPKKVELYLVDILVALVDECPALPSEVLETIMSQFMDQNARLDQAAYRTAVQLCNSTADKLQRHVSQYFTDIIVSESSMHATSPEDFNEIRTAHELIKRLHRSCPALLHSVIPQLEEELRVEEVQLRGIATQVLGEMYGSPGGHGYDLVKNYPTTWNEWLKRRNDKNASVRLKFAETAGALIGNLPQVKDAIEDALNSKLFDPDEKIRGAVCKLYSQLDYETALHHVSDEQLKVIAGRGMDKKHYVRSEALTALGKLFSLAYPEIESNDPAAIKHFSWIPNEILHMLSLGTEVRGTIEMVVALYILPLPSSATTRPSTSKNTLEIDDGAWTERLLTVMKFLDEKAIQGLLLLTSVKQPRPTVFEHYLDACAKYNGGVIDENEDAVTRKLNGVVQAISSGFLEPHKASEDLHTFAKLNEGRLYKLLKSCMDPQTDLKGLVKATNEFTRRIEQSSPAINSTMTTLLYRASLRIFNQSSIPTFIKAIQKDNGKASIQTQTAAKHSQTLMAFISKHFPVIYKPHVTELSKAIASEKSETLVETCLQALAAVVRCDDKLALSDKRIIERITRYATGEHPRHAKFAARLLAFSKDRDAHCSQVLETITNEIEDSSDDILVARMSVLVQFARFAPEVFDHQSEQITVFALQNILMVPTPPPDEMDADDEEWAEEDSLSSAIKVKVLALKMFRNRCLSHASDDNPLEIATPVLKMLVTTIEQGGTLILGAAEEEDPKSKARLRLQAAVSLLHLSTIETYLHALSPKFVSLALTVQDTCYNVRFSFLNKLVAFMQSRKLPPRFNLIPFMTVHDPEADVKILAANYVVGAFKKLPPALKVEHFELIFIRLLHLLAHHPDFSASNYALLDMAKHIQLYLDLIATPDNISLIYNLAAKAKTVRDADSHTHSENLYVMSELAQELIKTHAHNHSWSIASYPGKVKLPPDILRPLPSVEAANKVIKTVYLPEYALAWLKEPIKEKREKEKVPTKRKASTTRRPKKKRRKDDDDDDDDEENDDDDDDESSVADDEDGVEKAASSRKASSPLSDLGDDDGDGEQAEDEDLGRGARTRAKRRQHRRSKHGMTLSEADIASRITSLREEILVLSEIHNANYSTTTKLPPEVLSQIFECLVVVTRLGPSRAFYTWVQEVAHICRSWRSIALSTPRLWSVITLYRKEWAELVLQRAKSAPLDLTFPDLRFVPIPPATAETGTDLLKVAFAHSEHIRSIHITFGDDRFDGALELITSLTANTPCRELERLNISSSSPWKQTVIPDELFRQSRLSHLELRNCMVSLDRERFSHLRSLHLVQELKSAECMDLLEALSAMHELETLSLEDNINPEEFDGEPIMWTRGAVQMPSLRKVALKADFPEPLGILKVLVAPLARNLDVDLAGIDDAEDITAAYSFLDAGQSSTTSAPPQRVSIISAEDDTLWRVTDIKNQATNTTARAKLSIVGMDIGLDTLWACLPKHNIVAFRIDSGTSSHIPSPSRMLGIVTFFAVSATLSTLHVPYDVFVPSLSTWKRTSAFPALRRLMLDCRSRKPRNTTFRELHDWLVARQGEGFKRLKKLWIMGSPHLKESISVMLQSMVDSFIYRRERGTFVPESHNIST
ncbi:hypothetical protein EYR36_003038 [Pleurotus pulmonarius]|nr:hypothetical protein EYR36_003038 [Pleurotus pulmonarius]